MAHSLEIESFDDNRIKDIIDAATPPKMVLINTKDGVRKVNLNSRVDKFLITLISAIMQMWQLIDESNHATPAKDLMLLPAGRGR
jgi:hypothetical protein